MSNLVTPELSFAQVSTTLSARLLKIFMAALPWMIIAALLCAGIFIRPQPVGSTIIPAPLESRDQFYGLAQLPRSEEHTPERQSRENLVCRLLLGKKNLNKL